MPRHRLAFFIRSASARSAAVQCLHDLSCLSSCICEKACLRNRICGGKQEKNAVWWRRCGLLVFPQSRFARPCAGGGRSGFLCAFRTTDLRVSQWAPMSPAGLTWLPHPAVLRSPHVSAARLPAPEVKGFQALKSGNALGLRRFAGERRSSDVWLLVRS